MTKQNVTENDREAVITELIRRYEKDLHRLCRVYLHDPEAAKDAVQETFLKAYMHLDERRDESRTGQWLFSIAVNICRDELRSAWRRRVVRMAEPDENALSSTWDGGEARLLMNAVMELPPKYKEAVILRYIVCLDLRETASILKLTKSGVSRRCKKACRMLKEQLEGSEENEH